MIQGQIALKKESDGNDDKLIGTRNKCNTQTVYYLVISNETFQDN